jgi:CheY-like chemotaxis protein
MKTMLESGVEKIRQGITTIEEVASACTIEQEVPEKAEPISEEKPVVVKPPEPVTAPQTVQVEAAETCEQCGTKLEKRWLMCPVCGKPKAVSAQPAEEKGERILVAEDDPDARKMLQILLQRQKYQVIQAVDGEEALEKIRIEQPDAVILDINMPKLDGLSVCKAMRADMETMFIPVILLTALDSIESKLQGLSSGADDYMTKPFHPDELLARVDAILRRAAKQQTPLEKKAN